MKKAILTSLFTLAISFVSLASGNLKTTDLKGNITDKQGEPLVGVKVYVPSIDKSVYTDFDGNFNITNVPMKEQSLQISYISYNEEEINIDAENLNSALHFELQSK